MADESRGPGEASTSGQDQGMAVELDNVVFGYDPVLTRTLKAQEQKATHLLCLQISPSSLHGYSDVEESDIQEQCGSN